ncbi:hypothetical protein K6119_02270 [Paracrocinitomix mangrovi]|uniref:hypothetical protein n=1 Tax=Paracrocinitomix mangrovi TaxID=2862509 RepID=UPI001C8DDD23|nr:hypothetical protein [Paracrocinitomix mangrovi]UKN02345.1 hypothetical protein K6119_02270 [Paracrocinitomix mangrovi]
MKKNVKIEMKGGFRKAGIIVETEVFHFRGPGEETKEIEMDDDNISLDYVIKGSKYAQFQIDITINETTKKVPGLIKSASRAEKGNVDFSLSDFNPPLS